MKRLQLQLSIAVLVIPPPPSLYFNLFPISVPLKTLQWESFVKGYRSTGTGRRWMAVSGLQGDSETPLSPVGAARGAGESTSRVSICRRTTGLIKRIGCSNLMILRTSFAVGAEIREHKASVSCKALMIASCPAQVSQDSR